MLILSYFKTIGILGQIRKIFFDGEGILIKKKRNIVIFIFKNYGKVSLGKSFRIHYFSSSDLNISSFNKM